jgi:hypothetical protein
MDAIEAKARELCVADGREPDADWRVGDGVMLSVAVEHPENWRQYIRAAKVALSQEARAP